MCAGFQSSYSPTLNSQYYHHPNVPETTQTETVCSLLIMSLRVDTAILNAIFQIWFSYRRSSTKWLFIQYNYGDLGTDFGIWGIQGKKNFIACKFSDH